MPSNKLESYKKVSENKDFCNVIMSSNKLESYEKVWENKDFCNVIMPAEETKILEINQYQKFDKAPFIIYAHLEC